MAEGKGAEVERRGRAKPKSQKKLKILKLKKYFCHEIDHTEITVIGHLFFNSGAIFIWNP